MFIRPILDKPKSVNLMWPMDVINRLEGEEEKGGIGINKVEEHTSSGGTAKHKGQKIKEDSSLFVALI